MRDCPICLSSSRTVVFSMMYRVPDGWTLPDRIDWHTCDACGFLYGDGEFTQADLNTYYREKYGYGINNPSNIQRLKSDAEWIAYNQGLLFQGTKGRVIVDFGGAGDDGKSILVDELQRFGFINAVCIGAGDPLPDNCDVIYASHVIEHIYDLPEVMMRFVGALAEGGTLIIDVPDATGLLQYWKMPILDFNTKHINHFTLRHLLELGAHYGFELVKLKQYELENAPAWQAHFKRLDVAQASARHIAENIGRRIEQLKQIREPVNVWGLGDITWHLLSQVDLDVLDYVDNDPAYRGATYNGKPVLERPTNDAPIVIMSQGQRQRLIANIRAAGIQNKIIEV